MVGAMMRLLPQHLLRLRMMLFRTEAETLERTMVEKRVLKEVEEEAETTSAGIANKRVILPVTVPILKFAGDAKRKATKRTNARNQPSVTTAEKKAMRQMNVLNQRNVVVVSRKVTRSLIVLNQ